MQAGVHITLMF